jgi:hypothetical protein
VAALGNLGENLSATLHVPPGNYYWSVQAVDSGFAGSPFAAEEQFSISPLTINSVRLASGIFEFGFTAMPGMSFTALAITNLSQASGHWDELGVVPEVAPGQYQFTDPAASNHPQRFYRVRSP